MPNEAAFYGPKIDVQVWSVIGREFTLATNQVDFAVPARFGLVYRDKDNTDKTPLCIHRAPLGTHERFIGFLIEHYAGNFPLWLAPEQVRVLTIGEEEPLMNYAKAIVNELRASFVRVEGDYSTNKINGKIQDAEKAKVHTMLVIGGRDMDAGNVSVRLHGRGSTARSRRGSGGRHSGGNQRTAGVIEKSREFAENRQRVLRKGIESIYGKAHRGKRSSDFANRMAFG